MPEPKGTQSTSKRVSTETTQDHNNPDEGLTEAAKNLILEELGPKGLEEFRRARDRDKQRKIRVEIETEAKYLLEESKATGGFQEMYEEVVEDLNKVYRKAWTKACENLGHNEEEFPSKY